MQNPLFFRTYLTRLWLYLFVFPPIAIIMILGMADSSMLNEEGSSLKFVVYFSLALLFTIPVFLFFLSLSAVALKFTGNPGRLRRFTIVLVIMGIIAVFWIVYDAASYSNEQLAYGIFFTACYCIAAALLGLRLKL